LKTIGLLGGMSWESSLEYYRLLNEGVKQRLGGLHSCRCLLYSVDFGEIEPLMREGDWDSILRILTKTAKRLEDGGADLILLCTNTMHKLFEKIQETLKVPMIHIADAAAEKVIKEKIKKVGLLGTRFTMEQDFYRSRLEARSLQAIIPRQEDRETIDRIIFQELCLGEIRPKSRKEYKRIIEDLVFRGAEGIILGCTEIPLLVKEEDSRVPLFDTTLLHVQAALERAQKPL